VALAWLRSSKILAHLHGEDKNSISALVGFGIHSPKESK
jgi:hypothetical protein